MRPADPAMPSRRHALLLAILLTAAAGSAQSAAERTEARTFTGSKATLAYRLFTPPDAGPDRTFPLVLFLHGAGERGDDNAAQLRHGVGEFLRPARQEANPCFVVAPQCPSGRWWDPVLLQEFADAMAALPGVDPDRVYLTGLSMGGYATWHLLGSRPELFAAAIPICGGGQAATAPAFATVPVWAFHGDADPVVKVDLSRTMVEALRTAGGDPKYTEYPGVRHDSWTRTYRDDEVHQWLFAQRRRAPVPLRDGDRVVFLGDSITWSGARDGGYIRLLEQDLAGREPKLAAELIGAGISGNKVPDLLARLDADVLAHKPTVVVVYIGINDVWHSLKQNGTPKDVFAAGLRELLDRIAGAGARAILCTPSVIGEKTDGSNQLDAMLAEYAAIARRVARQADVALLDLRWRFLRHLREHNQDQRAKGVLTTDGVHLNPAGNRFVADCMLAALGVAPTPARPADK